MVVLRSRPQEFNTAAKAGKLLVTGDIPLMITIGDRMVDDLVLISPDLSQEMIIGAGTMQKWDISIENRNGAHKYCCRARHARSRHNGNRL